MKTLFITAAALLAVGSAFAGPDSDSAALTKLRQIPPATDYIPKDDNNPKIPLLILSARGASINRGTFIPFDQVLTALAKLPRTAWTQGRVILYYSFPPGLSSRGDEAPTPMVKQVEKELKAADIKLIYGASA